MNWNFNLYVGPLGPVEPAAGADFDSSDDGACEFPGAAGGSSGAVEGMDPAAGPPQTADAATTTSMANKQAQFRVGGNIGGIAQAFNR